jgi:hypothetical protein
VYKTGAEIMDRGPMSERPSGRHHLPMASAPRPPRSARSASGGDPLLGEVRWRLFRQEDLPARLRRLQRLEEVAEASPLRRNGSAPENQRKTEPEAR